MKVKYDGMDYELSSSLLSSLCKKYNLSKEKIFEKLVSQNVFLFNENLFCRITRRPLIKKIRFSKELNRYVNEIEYRVPRPLLSYYFYSEEVIKHALKMGFGINHQYMKGYLLLLKETNDFLKISKEDCIKKFEENFKGENSPLGLCRKKSIEKYENCRKKISSKTKNRMSISTNNPFAKKYWQDKGYSLEESSRKVRERNFWCKEYWGKRCESEEEALKKCKESNPSFYNDVESYREVLEQSPVRKEYWIKKGFSLLEAKKKTREYLIYCNEYWVKKGFSLEESKLKSKENNYFCVEYWIRKGKTIDDFYKFVIDKAKENQWSNLRYSKMSNSFFEKLLRLIKDKSQITTFVQNGFEKRIGRNFVDFIDEKINLIIEFQGDCFHVNPKIFKDKDLPHPFLKEKTAIEIQKKDLERKNKLKELGYEVIFVWQSDDHNEKIQEIIKKYYENKTKD